MRLEEDDVLEPSGTRDDMMDHVKKALRYRRIKRSMGKSRGRS